MNNLSFRAWHKEQNQMYNVSSIFWGQDRTDEMYFKLTVNHIAIECPQDSIILMQSTGLFDCIGKEIFEGDVISLSDEWKGINQNTWKINRDNRLSRWVTQQIVPDAACKVEITFPFLPLKGLIPEYKILGNIYDHPALLRSGK